MRNQREIHQAILSQFSEKPRTSCEEDVTENGGFFVNRVKDKVDPLIVGTNRKCHGRMVDIVGNKLSEVLPKLKRQVLDVEVEISFKRSTMENRKNTQNVFDWLQYTT